MVSLNSVSSFWTRKSNLTDSFFALFSLFLVVNSNDNDLVDLKNLFVGLDVLDKRTTSSCSSYWSGGHDVSNTNDEDLIDLKNLNIGISVLSHKGKKFHKVPKKCVKSYNAGHNISNVNDSDVSKSTVAFLSLLLFAASNSSLSRASPSLSARRRKELGSQRRRSQA